jgi:malic enzyme
MKQAATRAIADIVTDDQRSLGVIIPTMFQSKLHQAVARAVSDAWLAEHPDGRKRDSTMLAEPGADFGMPDLPSLIPSDDRAS